MGDKNVHAAVEDAYIGALYLIISWVRFEQNAVTRTIGRRETRGLYVLTRTMPTGDTWSALNVTHDTIYAGIQMNRFKTRNIVVVHGRQQIRTYKFPCDVGESVSQAKTVTFTEKKDTSYAPIRTLCANHVKANT